MNPLPSAENEIADECLERLIDQFPQYGVVVNCSRAIFAGSRRSFGNLGPSEFYFPSGSVLTSPRDESGRRYLHMTYGRLSATGHKMVMRAGAEYAGTGRLKAAN